MDINRGVKGKQMTIKALGPDDAVEGWGSDSEEDKDCGPLGTSAFHGLVECDEVVKETDKE